MEQKFDSVVIVRPGSSIYEYLDELQSRSWLLIHVHPEHFTIAEALLFIRQNKEEQCNFGPEYEHTTPHKKVIFFDYKLLNAKEIMTLRIYGPENSCLVHGYHSRYSHYKGDFEESFADFKDGIDDVRKSVQST